MARELDNWIDSYLEYVFNTESPVTYHTWAAVSLIAGALQRKVHFKWGFEMIYPNFYIILVGPAGRTRKGVSLGIAKNMLLNVPGVSVAPESGTRESMILAMKRATTNYEDSLNGKIKMHCSLTAFSEELSVLLGQADIKLLANLTDWFDSKDNWSYETVGRGRDSLEGLCFNLLGATAPEWIQSMLPQEAIGGGFTSRVIFIVEEKKAKTVAKHQLTDDEEELGEMLTRDLERISQLSGRFNFDEHADKAYTDWYTEQDKQLAKGIQAVEDHRFAAYCERRSTHIRKLMMIMSAARSDSMVITLKDFERARDMLLHAERKMGWTFGGLGKARNSDCQHKIMEFISKVGVTTRSSVLSKFYRDIDSIGLAEIEKTMEEMMFISVAFNLTTKDKIYRLITKEGSADE